MQDTRELLKNYKEKLQAKLESRFPREIVTLKDNVTGSQKKVISASIKVGDKIYVSSEVTADMPVDFSTIKLNIYRALTKKVKIYDRKPIDSKKKAVKAPLIETMLDESTVVDAKSYAEWCEKQGITKNATTPASKKELEAYKKWVEKHTNVR